MRKIYGIIGTDVNGGMFNADFTGRARRDSQGNMIHSDVSLKYCFRRAWALKDGLDSVLAYTKYDKDLNPTTLEDNFKFKFPKIEKTKQDVLKQLLTYKDVRNFGMAFAVAKNNISLIGPVQIGWGININENEIERSVQILSPYASGKGKGQTTLGTQYIVDNALFVAPLIINFTEDYKEEDYKDFVETSKRAVTETQSRSMVACNSAFSCFVELKDEVIPTDLLSSRVKLDDDNQLIFDFEGLDLKSVELFANIYKYDVKIINSNIKIKVENLF